MKSLLVNWGPVILWCGVIFWVSSMPHMSLSDQPLVDFILRKSAHVAEYAILSLLMYRAIEQNEWKHWRWRLAIVVLVASWVFAASDEIHQTLVPTRHGTITDWLIDGSGVALGLAIAVWLVWWRRALGTDGGRKNED